MVLRSCSGHCLARSGKVQLQRFPENLCRGASHGATHLVWHAQAVSSDFGLGRICSEPASHGATQLLRALSGKIRQGPATTISWESVPNQQAMVLRTWVQLRRFRQNLLRTSEPWCYAGALGIVWQDRARSRYNGFLRVCAEPESHSATHLVWQAPSGSAASA